MSYAVNAWNPVGKTPPDLPKGNLPEPTLAEAVDASITKALYRRCRKIAQGIVAYHACRGVKTDEEETYQKLVAVLRDGANTLGDVLVPPAAQAHDPSREHTLVFHGTPDEFAFFKARLDEWAKKRIST